LTPTADWGALTRNKTPTPLSNGHTTKIKLLSASHRRAFPQNFGGLKTSGQPSDHVAFKNLAEINAEAGVAIIFKYKRSGGTGKFPQQHTLAHRLGFLGLLVFLVGKGKRLMEFLREQSFELFSEVAPFRWYLLQIGKGIRTNSQA
jgi:hypothetical protein